MRKSKKQIKELETPSTSVESEKVTIFWCPMCGAKWEYTQDTWFKSRREVIEHQMEHHSQEEFMVACIDRLMWNRIKGVDPK